MVFTTEFDYELILPKEPMLPGKTKILVVLHGLGDSLKPFRRFNEELPLPGFCYLLLNAPRKYDGGYTWNAFAPRHQPEIDRNRNKLFRMLEELDLQGFPGKDIFLLGHSQGCQMMMDVVLRYPKVLGGAMGISGCINFNEDWLEEVSKAAYQTPMIMTHGIRDRVIPIKEAREDALRLMFEAGLPLQWKEFPKGHDVCVDYETLYLKSWVENLLKERRAVGLVGLPKLRKNEMEVSFSL